MTEPPTGLEGRTDIRVPLLGDGGRTARLLERAGHLQRRMPV